MAYPLASLTENSNSSTTTLKPKFKGTAIKRKKKISKKKGSHLQSDRNQPQKGNK
ncbi:uncharacterized protein G2W53_001119 [Senna tora]|uniref:Uncharacterized protein n=1 Tax=Senna tora TaxID=362788 RepID=A0A835CJ50_9FABA|nr:uncharacterized protein G2W53_001119 [Senna tora]